MTAPPSAMNPTNDEIDCGINEWIGWTPTPYGTWTLDPAGLKGPFCHEWQLPSYTTGREALQNCFEAENKLGGKQVHDYQEWLRRILAKEDKDENWKSLRAAVFIWNAPAHIRALALYKTITS